MTRRLAALALVAMLAPAPASVAASPRASLPDIEDEVMCPVCGVPLSVAQAPQAQREREFIRGLIARGRTKAQIKRELVAEFGSSVLALPKASGFDVTVYLVPLALGVATATALALALVRRHRRGDAGAPRASTTLSGADARRLEEDLSRYDV